MSTEHKLKIKVASFSYKTVGIPADDSGNGGGFVFDCRGILNPGRIEQYKKLNGLDKPVRDYLENETLMPQFIEHVIGLLDISVQDYINRGFENLMISFGCTGGQHRSVYAADVISKYLREKYGVDVSINHIVQQIQG
jgi:RNase adaptor protein for sRNA GlmZ degradation